METALSENRMVVEYIPTTFWQRVKWAWRDLVWALSEWWGKDRHTCTRWVEVPPSDPRHKDAPYNILMNSMTFHVGDSPTQTKGE